MNYSPGELHDRLSILELKRVRQQNASVEELVVSIRSELVDAGVWDEGRYAELLKTNGAIWDLESDIRLGREDLLGLEEVGRRALIIRNINAKRIRIVTEINSNQKGPLQDKHTDHLINALPSFWGDYRWLTGIYRSARRGVVFSCALILAGAIVILSAAYSEGTFDKAPQVLTQLPRLYTMVIALFGIIIIIYGSMRYKKALRVKRLIHGIACLDTEDDNNRLRLLSELSFVLGCKKLVTHNRKSIDY